MKDLTTGSTKVKSRLRMNKRVSVILICFMISTVFWLLIALSHDYSSTLTFPVNYSNLPGKKVVMNDLPSKITVRLSASGFRLITFGFKKEMKPVDVDVASSLMNTSINTDLLALPTQNFVTDFSKELGSDVKITGFQPDSIIFNFSDLTTKRIPVQLNMVAGFQKQYDSTGAPDIAPSVIEVSGPPSLVEKLTSVQTEKIVFDNLKTTVKKKVKLIGNRLLSYNVNEVEVTIPVEKFTEGSATINVKPVNVTTGYSLKTFPDKVKVRYLVALSRYNKVDPSMFDIVVDAGDLDERHPLKLDVKLITNPSFVKITSFEPDKVEYILRKQ